MTCTVGVLGPVTAWLDAAPVRLGGLRHRELLARLAVARGRVVPVPRLVDDLWDVPPEQAVASIRTFVAALRRALEPDRAPRAVPQVLVTAGPGYALRTRTDADEFAAAVTGAGRLPPAAALAALEDGLSAWRGPAYADVADRPWARPERARLAELRATAVERAAAARLALGRAEDAVPGLDAHVAEHPWREQGWLLLALALHRSGRQRDALALLRRARTRLADELGLDPSARLAELERDVLHGSPSLDQTGDVWTRAATSYQRTAGPRARLESTVTLLRSLAVSGSEGLTAARHQRLAVIAAAEQLGDPLLTARVIGAFDVPGSWTRSDDPAQAASVVAAAERALPATGPDAVRARLLTTVAVESRGLPGPRGPAAAAQAERLARELGDPAVLCSALGGRSLQAASRAGMAAERDTIGTELVELAGRHGLWNHLVLGHLVRMQALSALGDLTAANVHADLLDDLALEHDRPLVTVFTTGWRAMREAVLGSADAERAFRSAARRRVGSGMPGLDEGLLALQLASLQVSRGLPVRVDAPLGPYEPWIRPHLLLAARAPAARAVADLPDPPPGLLLEALWALAGRAALAVGDAAVKARAHAALAPASGEIAGAGSGMLTLGPVSEHLLALDG